MDFTRGALVICIDDSPMDMGAGVEQPSQLTLNKHYQIQEVTGGGIHIRVLGDRGTSVWRTTERFSPDPLREPVIGQNFEALVALKAEGKIPPPTPECDKLSAIKQESQKIGDFLEWASETGIVLARYSATEAGLLIVAEPRDEILSEYFDIDPVRLDAERRAVLDWIKVQNTKKSLLSIHQAMGRD